MWATYRRWIVGFVTMAAAIVAFFWFGAIDPPSDTAPETRVSLPALGADLSGTSVSGISSGAYMAGQFQIAHASMIVGAGIIAGGPYGCAQSVFSGVAPDGPGTVLLSASRAVNGCMQNALAVWGVPDPKRLADKARALSAENLIDPISDVANDRVYIFSGSNDQTVKPPIVEAAAQFYRELGVPTSNILFRKDLAAGHGFVTEDNGKSCEVSAQPFVVDCDYDQAGALLNHIYADLAPRVKEATGVYVEFDQRELAPQDRAHGLSATAVAYIPNSCRTQPGCRVHVAFHGCSQNRAAVGRAFIEGTEFARWADPNRIIVLFPQVSTGTLNPTGCWDWWGYTGRDYLTRNAPQIVAVRAMLERLAADPGAAATPES